MVVWICLDSTTNFQGLPLFTLPFMRSSAAHQPLLIERPYARSEHVDAVSNGRDITLDLVEEVG
jgi:hypothetical protein